MQSTLFFTEIHTTSVIIFTEPLTASSNLSSIPLTRGVMQLPESVLDAAAFVVAHGSHVTGLSVPARGSFATL